MAWIDKNPQAAEQSEMKKRKKLYGLVRLYTDVTRNRFWLVKFTNARKTIDVQINIDKGNTTFRKAKRGVPWECVLSKGIMAFARQHSHLFPHPVLHAYTIRSAIYLVTREHGQPTHAVRYLHDFGSLASRFDRITKDRFLEEFDGHGFNLRLRPAKKGGHIESNPNRIHGKAGDSRAIPISRGALGRAQEAGFTEDSRIGA